jgi:hypothetical protein
MEKQIPFLSLNLFRQGTLEEIDRKQGTEAYRAIGKKKELSEGRFQWRDLGA